MWWQVLPPSFLILGLIGVPFIANPILHYVVTGRPTIRGLTEGNWIDPFQRSGYKRDWSITGSEWESRGLDNITDDS